MIAPATPDIELGLLSMSAKDGNWTLKCDALAADNARQLALVSCAGPHTIVKAFCAGLWTGNATFSLRTSDKNANNLVRHPEGYVCRRSRLGLNVFHVVALAKNPNLMPVADEASLWQKLRDSRFTTPLLREWMPYVLGELVERKGLVKLVAWQCEAAMLLADNAMLDAIVTEGIQTGAISV